MAALWMLFGEYLSFDYLIRQERRLRAFQNSYPLLTYVIALITYVLLTGLSLPVGTLLTFLYAWLFGFWPAVVLVSFASAAGATLAFLISRNLLRDWVRTRFADRLEAVNRALDREGWLYLITLRMTPVVPFFLVNLLLGVTAMRLWTFWWASQLGMLPATTIYSYIGALFPSLQEIAERSRESIIKAIIALSLLALVPLAMKKGFDWWQSRRRPA